MLDIVRIGSFGIFRTEHFLRATPETTTSFEARLEFVPKLPMESFRFVLVEKTLIEIALYFTDIGPQIDATDTGISKIVDASNARATDRRITLDEDEVIALLGFDAETYPARKQSEAGAKLAAERIEAINFRAWIAKIKKYTKARSEFDEAMATLPAQDHADYRDLFQKALKNGPTDEETSEQPMLRAKIEAAFSTRFEALKDDSEFLENLSSKWTQAKDVNAETLTSELLDECLEKVFGISSAPQA